MSRKKILLTGGNGFIGKNILEILSTKYEIIAPKREELELALGEILSSGGGIPLDFGRLVPTNGEKK